MRLLSTIALIAALAWSGAASAGSTINPSVPAQGAPLSSGPVRSNFAAAFNDINNIEGCFSGTSAPGNPTTFQLWCDTTGAPTNVKVKQFDGAQWVITGFLNTTTHIYLPAGSGGTPIINTPNIFTVVQTIDLGSGASEPAIGSGGALAIYGADSANVRYEATAFSNSTGSTAVFDGRTSLGTRLAPQTVVISTLLASFEGKGYDGSVWTGTGGALHVYAQGTWTTSSHPGQACLATTPTGGTTTANNLCVNQDGSASLVGALTAPTLIGASGGPLLLQAPSGQSVQFAPNGGGATAVVNTAGLLPINDNSITIGGSANRWSNIYGVTATVGTLTSPASANLALNAPTGQTVNFTVNGVVEASVSTGGVVTVGVPGSQQGSLQIASPTANSMNVVSASSATGTATIPNGSYTLVGDSLAQTLTNKTLASSTDVLGGVTMTLGSDAEGDIYYRHSGVLTRLGVGANGTALELVGGIPAWAAVSGTGTVTSVAITGSGGNAVSGTCPSAITTTGTCQVAAPGGFLNFLRNNSMTAWFHGCVASACTITTAGGWCAEGVWVNPLGASVTCQQTTTTVTGSFNNILITGNTSVTTVTIRYVVESYTMGRFFGKNVTFQNGILNSTGASLTPSLTTKFPTAQDNWTSSTQDLAPTSLQTCTNTSLCAEAYTLAVTGTTANGYEFLINLCGTGGTCTNFNANTKSVTIGWFDARLDSSASTGLNSNPPPFEVRDPASDTAWNERFFQATYDNGVAPGTATNIGIIGNTGTTSSSLGEIGNAFRTTMRCDPVMSWWDGAGTANKLSDYNSTSWTPGQTGSAPQVVSVSTGQHGFVFYSNQNQNLSFHYTADCTISGG